MEKEDEVLAAALRARIVAAKARLAAKMQADGLKESAGWRVLEELRSTPTGTEFVFRPIHLKMPSPGYEETVALSSEGNPQ
jgi:hypothetical protein